MARPTRPDAVPETDPKSGMTATSITTQPTANTNEVARTSEPDVEEKFNRHNLSLVLRYTFERSVGGLTTGLEYE